MGHNVVPLSPEPSGSPMRLLARSGICKRNGATTPAARWFPPRYGSWFITAIETTVMAMAIYQLYMLITGYFYGIIHSIHWVISIYNIL